VTVRRRRDRGFWEYSFYVDGNRYRVGGWLTKREAEDAEAEARAKHVGGVAVLGRDVATGDYLAKWLETRRPPELVASTWQRYEELCRLYLRPALGKVPLRRLRPLDVQAALASIRGQGRAPRTVQQAYAVLHAALEAAVRWQLVARNVAAVIDKPKISRPQLTVPTIEETKALLQRAESTRFGLIYWLAALTGCREGELLALRWRNVDFAGGVMRVEGTARRYTGQGVQLQPDTKGHRARAVAIGGAAVGLLHLQRERQAADKKKWTDDYDDHGLVFANELGGPLDGTWVGRVWRRKVAEPAGMGAVRVHDLRHAHVSYLLGKGFSPKLVADRVGHVSAGFTMDTYGHIGPTLQAEAAEAVGEALR
jgi:integrase